MATSGFKDIVTSGLILSLDAANTKSYSGSGTTWLDLGSGGYNGNLVNSPSFNSDKSGCFVFNGSSQYANVSTPALTTLEMEGSLTYEYWVKPTGTVYGSFTETTTGTQYFTPGTNQGLGGDRSYRYNNLSYRGFQFCFGTNGFVAGLHNFDIAPVFLVDYKTYTGINHLVVIKNTYNCQYYINGTLRKTSLTSGAIIGDSMSTLTSFDGTYFGRYFSGNIYSIRFYKRALSSQEILQNYNALKNRFI
jgi:hypothetical protein